MKKRDSKNILMSFLVLGVLLVSLFYISKIEAEVPIVVKPYSNTSTSIGTFTAVPQTQTQIMGGDVTTETGTLNNSAADSCSKHGDNYAMKTLSENTSNSFKNYDYLYYKTIDIPWVGEVVYDIGQGTAVDVLAQPATYDIECMITQPQVQWRNLPASP